MRVSIITPTLNANTFIAEAVESVLAQTHGDTDHIVVDGGSTDGTLETLGRYAHLRVLVQPALGLYAALNLGLGDARGEVIGFLNADDRYLPGALAEAAARLAAAPSVECASGGARVVRAEPTGVRTIVADYDDAPHKMLDWEPLLYGAPVINARFFRQSLFERIGRFDISYKIAADREWLIRAKLAGMRILALDGVVYEYLEHAGSLTLNASQSNATRIRDEHLEIIYHYLRDLRDERAAAMFRRWHAWETGRKVMDHLAQGELGPARRVARRANTVSLRWPAQFLTQLPARITARLAR